MVFMLAAAASHASQANYPQRACCTGKENPKWYAGLSGNVVFLDDVDIGTSVTNASTGNQFRTISLDIGYGVGGVVGYRIFPNISTELEVMYRQNETDKFGSDPVTPQPGFYSAQKSVAVMGNLMYSYRQLESWYPYAGVGAGMVHVKAPFYITNGAETLTFKDWLFGYQFMAGVGYPIRNTPLELNAGYRFMKTEQGERRSVTTSDVFTFDNTTHNFDIGVKLNF
jgi:opacity protein-like surface antigen